MKTDHNFKVNNPETLKRAMLILGSVDLSEAWRFQLKPFKLNRSALQNNLYQKWCGIIGNDIGEPQSTMHTEFKKAFVVPIVERDDEDFALDMALWRTLYQSGQKEVAMQAVERAKKRVSTKWLNTKQFSELMDEVEKYAANLGIVLPQPDSE